MMDYAGINECDTQSVVYICIAMDMQVLKLTGNEINGVVHRGGYELCDGCPGGMLETTYWVMSDALPVLKSVAVARRVEMVGTDWFYDVCEAYGYEIINNVKINGLWPNDNDLVLLAQKVIGNVELI